MTDKLKKLSKENAKKFAQEIVTFIDNTYPQLDDRMKGVVFRYSKFICADRHKANKK